MARRFVSVWFPNLIMDWFALRQPQLKGIPFVLRASSHGKVMVTAASAQAQAKGIACGMVLADARAIIPDLIVLDDKPDLGQRLLSHLAEWCIRFTPVVAVDPADGLILEATGCTHLWNGDSSYLAEIVAKLRSRGYDARAAIADTVGAAWAVARYGREHFVITSGTQVEALLPLPPESLRLEPDTIERLRKLGLRQVSQFIRMPRASLRRRFGPHFMMRLDMAIGREMEVIDPIKPVAPYQERLPCLEPILTATGIKIALEQLLRTLCLRLQQERKGLRVAVFRCYRVDGKVEQVQIGTNRQSHDVHHLFKLFEIQLAMIAPALGIELFTLEALNVEDHHPQQEKIWEASGGLKDLRLAELLDRLVVRLGEGAVHRYLPDEHYWPERSIKPASSLDERSTTAWRDHKLRPLQLLMNPERIEVTAPIPDYPPMLFRYKGKLYKIVKADGPERIEQEWWLQQGQHRDYYQVEDEAGYRYWLFRLGHYHDQTYQWFIHGFFA